MYQVERFPEEGETLRTLKPATLFPGGKACNQAVSAARSECDVYLLGAVGDQDPLSETALNSLRREGIHCDGVVKLPGKLCGLATVMVKEGRNRILTSPGANAEFKPEHALLALSKIPTPSIVLLQLGIPIATVEAVIDWAVARKIPVFLDPTPFSGILPSNWSQAEFLAPNEVEFNQLIDFLANKKLSIDEGSRFFLDQGLKTLLLKLGENGSLGITEKQKIPMPSLSHIQVVDTTGAGDAYAGAFAAEWVRTRELSRAMAFGNIAGSLATTKLGAQSGIPTRSEIQSHLTEVGSA